MKLSLNWLKTLVPTSLSAADISAKLTGAGLEVEGLEPFETVKGGLKGLVIGQVKTCEKHPDADRLRVTTVTIGGEADLQIVCGAPNVEAGQKVIVATVGTTLYPKSGEALVIKKSKIRGVASEGMICAEDEIGMGSSHAGIMVLPESTPIGIPASEYFQLENDTVLEIGLTPNRSDATSHYGVARDLAAIVNSHDPDSKLRATRPGNFPLPEASGTKTLEIQLLNPEACPRYTGILISGITVKESPAWLKTRLETIGQRPINNIVDIGNFVMHEMGQPLHAFDADQIAKDQIIVRYAKADEKLLTLDGIERKLTATDLVICDGEKPMCLGGIFGGAHSGVTEATTSIFLESAFFDPDHIRRSAKQHGLKTDASFRFERGTDPDLCTEALNRAFHLIHEVAGGGLTMDVQDLYPTKFEPHKVAFSYSNCNEIIGKDLDHNKIKSILVNLGIEIVSEGQDGLLLHVPYYKHDVTREVDVTEEILRIYGYDQVEPGKHIHYTALNEKPNFALQAEERCASVLESFGFSEIMNLSLTSEKYYSAGEPLVKVLNPLSQELGVLRANMIHSGLETIAYNLNRKNTDLKLFEFGKTYKQNDGQYEEKKFLSLFVTGQAISENPYGIKYAADFAFLRSCVDQLLQKCGISRYTVSDCESADLQFGLEYRTGNHTLVQLGKTHSAKTKAFDLQQAVYYASFDCEVLTKAFSKRKTEYAELSRFPSVRRDLALLLDKKIRFSHVRDLAFNAEKKFLEEVNLFDIYQDEKLGDKKSYAVSFTLLNREATLTDSQIDSVMNKLIKVYKEELGAELR